MARALNEHPNLVTAIDDHVYECWALYYYPGRTGLVHELRTGEMTSNAVIQKLSRHLFERDILVGAAESAKTGGLNLTPPHYRTDGSRTVQDEKLKRFDLPLALFPPKGRICLKSPELVFVLPQLSKLLPETKFILVYRPILEIAESMFRKGNIKKKAPRFHKRWEREKDNAGLLIPPPSLPLDWQEHWQEATGFQRCLLNAAGYLKAMESSLDIIPGQQVFIYNHARLRENPARTFKHLTRFLGIKHGGFSKVLPLIRQKKLHLEDQLVREYQDIQEKTKMTSIIENLENTAI